MGQVDAPEEACDAADARTVHDRHKLEVYDADQGPVAEAPHEGGQAVPVHTLVEVLQRLALL